MKKSYGISSFTAQGSEGKATEALAKIKTNETLETANFSSRVFALRKVFDT